MLSIAYNLLQDWIVRSSIENPLYVAPGEWLQPESQAERQVEKSLGRSSPVLSAIAAPPK
jgi:hypothetical protein